MKEKFFSLFVFAFFAQLLLGQEKFTIRGEFPDNTLDGKYVLLIDKSSLLEEREGQKQAYANSIKIKVIGKEFFYEGTVTRKPFFAQISYDGPSFLDSLLGDPPRFIETIPSSSSLTIKNE